MPEYSKLEVIFLFLQYIRGIMRAGCSDCFRSRDDLPRSAIL